MDDAMWTGFDQALARRLDDVLAGELEHDPVGRDILPGGELGNHGLDVELTGLRTAGWATAGDKLVLRCRDGAGWRLDAVGRRELHPRVGEAVFRTPLDLIEPEEEETLEAWAHEGVPVRLRGLVGDAPMLVLDDGWRVVMLPRPSVVWSLTAA